MRELRSLIGAAAILLAIAVPARALGRHGAAQARDLRRAGDLHHRQADARRQIRRPAPLCRWPKSISASPRRPIRNFPAITTRAPPMTAARNTGWSRGP